MVSRLAQAMPTAVMDISNMFGFLKTYIDIKPNPPMIKQTTWVLTRPTRCASAASGNTTSPATPLYTAISTPTQLAPLL